MSRMRLQEKNRSRRVPETKNCLWLILLIHSGKTSPQIGFADFLTVCHCETRVGGARQSLSGLVSPLWRLCIAGGTLVQAL